MCKMVHNIFDHGATLENNPDAQQWDTGWISGEYSYKGILSNSQNRQLQGDPKIWVDLGDVLLSEKGSSQHIMACYPFFF